jgi:hypothetical protein
VVFNPWGAASPLHRRRNIPTRRVLLAPDIVYALCCASARVIAGIGGSSLRQLVGWGALPIATRKMSMSIFYAATGVGWHTVRPYGFSKAARGYGLHAQGSNGVIRDRPRHDV